MEDIYEKYANGRTGPLPLEVMNTKMANVLRRHGILNFEDFKGKTQADLFKMKFFHRKSLNYLKDFLQGEAPENHPFPYTGRDERMYHFLILAMCGAPFGSIAKVSGLSATMVGIMIHQAERQVELRGWDPKRRINSRKKIMARLKYRMDETGEEQIEEAWKEANKHRMVSRDLSHRLEEIFAISRKGMEEIHKANIW